MEQALFFARSENLDKDFLIRKVFIRNAVNAATYKREENAMLKIYTIHEGDPLSLILVDTLEDNGISMLPSELPRVFDKGFTGMNGKK